MWSDAIILPSSKLQISKADNLYFSASRKHPRTSIISTVNALKHRQKQDSTMGWFSSSPTPAQPATSIPQQPSTPDNLACELKPASAEKVKPCCVCKDEKSQRDECMLFSRSDDPQEDCKGLVAKYKDCMAGYGFKI
ncbi:hypothetical protein PV10_03933 [Exophiala mesophila]|uniref:Cytochrome c oxidase copper chaperone n=1 Tax=Exophiala mesophila TaxID=212818 RepID=A0A0D1WTW1_EXOME|nr:uncharacterized protein PV10_03933 [Exophiala mesophila]KIV92660.1 hypothetical protein PV10_03933 [Exophiala mesophila]